MSATFREVDETMERELFARRARAMGGEPGVPSLDAVLRAVREHEAEARPQQASPAGRAASAMRWSSVVLAAACFLVVLRTAPRPAVPGVIAADVRPDIAWSPSGASATCEEHEENACRLDRSSMPTLTSEPGTPVASVSARTTTDEETCEEPLPTRESLCSTSPALSCAGDESASRVP